MTDPTASHQRDTVSIKFVLEEAGWTKLSKKFSFAGVLNHTLKARLRYANDSTELTVK